MSDKTNVKKLIYYRCQHVTGPGCVLVSLRFDENHRGTPVITRLLGVNHTDSNVRFDLDRTVQEINAGVDAANAKYSGSLIIAEIQIVPDDYPTKGQSQYAAFKIAEAILTEVG